MFASHVDINQYNILTTKCHSWRLQGKNLCVLVTKLLFVFITAIDVISKTLPQFRNQAVIYLHDIIGDDLCHSATAGFPPLIRVSLVVIATIHQEPH